MTTLSIVCMALVAVLCAIGALSNNYPDNLLQRLGLAGTGAACAVLGAQVYLMQGVSPSCALLSVGLALYALGTAAKVLHFQRLAPRHIKGKS